MNNVNVVFVYYTTTQRASNKFRKVLKFIAGAIFLSSKVEEDLFRKLLVAKKYSSVFFGEEIFICFLRSSA